MNDFGILRAEGATYKGFFLNGQKHGLGYEASGDQFYYGRFARGNREGMGIYSDQEGKGFGRWVTDKKEGRHVLEKEDQIWINTYSDGELTATTSHTPTYTLETAGCVFGDCENGFGSYFYFPERVPTIIEAFFTDGQLVQGSIIREVNLRTNDVTYKDLDFNLVGKTVILEMTKAFVKLSEVDAFTDDPKGKVLIFFNDGYIRAMEVDGDMLVRQIFDGTGEGVSRN
ncbi:MAG: hypothetical protein Tsb0034_30200 [Ekhidna sp.]